MKWDLGEKIKGLESNVFYQLLMRLGLTALHPINNIGCWPCSSSQAEIQTQQESAFSALCGHY